MAISLRPPVLEELDSLSQLCLRSKAYWGYDADFMAACVKELTLERDALDGPLIVAEIAEKTAGVARLGWAGADADLLLLYVDPGHMGRGVGRCLFDWCVETAKSTKAPRLLIEADPHAVPFYETMGASVIGDTPSGSITGRRIPLLALLLK